MILLLEKLVHTDVNTELVALEPSRRIRKRTEFNGEEIFEDSKLFFCLFTETE